MWPVLVKFRSASSEGSWRKKKKNRPPATISGGLTKSKYRH